MRVKVRVTCVETFSNNFDLSFFSGDGWGGSMVQFSIEKSLKILLHKNYNAIVNENAEFRI